MIHLLLLALAVFYVWETARVMLPVALPGPLNALLLLGFTIGLDFVPDHWLALGAVAAVVAVLHQRFGTDPEPRSFRIRLPRRNRAAERAGGRIPPLP